MKKEGEMKMNMLKAFNSAMEYIEEHLFEEIDYRELAKISGCSGGIFPRFFSLLADMPLCEYIRLRRLSKAALEIKDSKEKIIDIAGRCGYESVDAFSAAFRKVHGNTPSLVRKGASFRVFSPIYFSLSVQGGAKMNMRWEKKKAFRVAGLALHQGKTSDFGGVWKQLMEKAAMQELLSLGSGESYGLCYDFEDKDRFSYMAGFDLQDESKAKHLGLEVLEVPEAEYAVFELVGAIPESIHKGWEYIMGTFFSEGKYEHAGSPDFEYYFEGDMYSPNYRMELWVPVKKK